jgi:hypothetical protein
MPGGIKEDLPLNAMPAPSVQFTLGLPSKMDVSIRMVPKIGENDVKGQLLGIGLKKDITSLFGVIEKTPLNVSLFAAYTTMNVDYDLQNDSSINGANQLAEFKLNAYTVQAIASLNFPVINFYGGIGYNGGTSSLNIKGTYKLEYKTNQPPPNDTFEETVTDPISQNFEANGFRTTLGTRLNLGPVKLFGDYTIQEYNTISLGLAVSIR